MPVFAAFVAADAAVRPARSTTASSGSRPAEARLRFPWPRERRALDDVVVLLGAGDAGPVEDVLRVC